LLRLRRVVNMLRKFIKKNELSFRAKRGIWIEQESSRGPTGYLLICSGRFLAALGMTRFISE
jgi:hypothetical protein